MSGGDWVAYIGLTALNCVFFAWGIRRHRSSDRLLSECEGLIEGPWKVNAANAVREDCDAAVLHTMDLLEEASLSPAVLRVVAQVRSEIEARKSMQEWRTSASVRRQDEVAIEYLQRLIDSGPDAVLMDRIERLQVERKKRLGIRP